MKYDIARPLFRNGDIVFFHGRGWMRKLVQWCTKGRYHHVGIAFWCNVGDIDRLLIAEAQPDGYRLVNLGYCEGQDLTVFRCPVDWDAIQNIVINSTGKVKYDFIDLILVGLHERFGLPIPSRLTGPGDICSVITAKILQSAGWKIDSTMVSPNKLANILAQNFKPAFEVEG